MSKTQRILYVLSKNPEPSPIEFAKLYMEITNIERCCKAGKAAFDSCKAAHREYDKNFKFNSLSKSEQKEYKKICESSSECTVCGRAVADDKIHCSKKCAANACEVCNGPVELTESSREVLDQVNAGKMHSLRGILSLRGMKQPPIYLEQLEQYHKACRARLSCFAACSDCQEQRETWTKQQEDWNQFGCKSEDWWVSHQARLEELQKQPEKTMVVERKRTCAAGCSGEERAAKRRRNEDDAFEADQKRRRSMFAEPQA